ncbi:hypothetical protein PQG02_23645 [Nostoc sp. UHCC 0926]|uniref:hypothetical protein n=1 Tax=unclassified Nostoc TaxID=2593658 RepID=UPI0023605BE1|nr:hypothetical protein [Nostoc sp. UHCC 0926]WDD31666.1 hypothetical protein PQG02_23645 [Nostoc sp. UHCC 0926]
MSSACPDSIIQRSHSTYESDSSQVQGRLYSVLLITVARLIAAQLKRSPQLPI